jgi:hypothetical protein
MRGARGREKGKRREERKKGERDGRTFALNLALERQIVQRELLGLPVAWKLP